MQGRPSNYKPEYNHIAYVFCRKNGVIDKELADLFQVDIATIYRWKDKHEAFCDAIKKGKDEFDTGRVENAFLNRALGFEHVEKKIKKDGSGKVIEEIETDKFIPPDTAAGFIWLKNRNPDRWKDQQKIEHDTNITVVSGVDRD